MKSSYGLAIDAKFLHVYLLAKHIVIKPIELTSDADILVGGD